MFGESRNILYTKSEVQNPAFISHELFFNLNKNNILSQTVKQNCVSYQVSTFKVYRFDLY